MALPDTTKLKETLSPASTTRSSRQEVLMNLIAKEMTSAWLDEEEDGEITAELQPSAEDLFYAQLNGEEIDIPTPPRRKDVSTDRKGHHNEEKHNDCDGSFSKLVVPRDVFKKGRTTSRRSLESNTSSKSSSKRNPRGSRPKRRTSICSASTTSEETLSISEIQQYVMETMPPEIRDKIPKEAWAQIFGKSNPAKTRKPAKRTVDFDKEVADTTVETSDNDDDELSLLSDISTPSSQNGFQAPLTPEETAWEEETFQKSGSPSSSKVSFSYVQVRYYERILEINPAVTNGPAIGIGWRFKRGRKIGVDEWEHQRENFGREGSELILPRPLRERILYDVGYNQKQIAQAIRVIRRAKERRKVTVQNLGSAGDALEETLERASRRIKSLLSFGRKKGLVARS